MRLKTYTSALLFAVIVMLAHAIVPHHHHDGMLVALFGTSEAAMTIEAEHHGDSPTHRGETGVERCAQVSLPTKKASLCQILKKAASGTDGAHYTLLYCLCAAALVWLYAGIGFAMPAKPYSGMRCHGSAHAVSSLRAPPSFKA